MDNLKLCHCSAPCVFYSLKGPQKSSVKQPVSLCCSRKTETPYLHIKDNIKEMKAVEGLGSNRVGKKQKVFK